MNRGIKQARKRTLESQKYQSDIVSAACFCTLWDYGWNEDRIMPHFIGVNEILVECNKRGMSPFEVFEQETGIELSLDGEKSYHEFAYLSEDTKVQPLTDEQYIYMLQRKIKWIPLILLSALCIELHRTEGWGFEQLAEFMEEVNTLRARLGEEKRNYDKYMHDKTGFYPKEMWGE